MQTVRNVVAALALVAACLTASATDVAVLQNGFSIRHERREVINSMTRLYVTKEGASYIDIPTAEIEHFEKDLTPLFAPPTPIANSASLSTATAMVGRPSSAKNLNEVVNSVSSQYHLDPDLVTSVIRAESGFNAHAVSPKGARGLMQLMPKTATQLGVPNAFDPQANVQGGTRYLRELLERYNFDLVKALAAYNAGPQRVEQYRGVPPYYETRAYVARIVRDFNRKKAEQDKLAKAASSLKPASSVKTQATRQHVSSSHAPAPVKTSSASASLQSE
jgi:soluble lytic murein transglycosylase-like protein